MSLIDKIRKPKSIDSDNTDKWKEKYYTQLDKVDSIEQLNAKNDEIYRQTLNRLCLVVRGVYAGLDPHLLKIRTKLKGGISSAELTLLLEKFSQELLSFDETKNALPEERNTHLLFDFLVTQGHCSETVEAIKRVCEQFESGKLKSTAELIWLINKLCSSIESDVTAPPVQLSGETVNLDMSEISQQFIELIQGLDIPNTSQKQADKIISSLNEEQSEDHFSENIEAALDFLQEIK
jgi:hypothetical protein